MIIACGICQLDMLCVFGATVSTLINYSSSRVLDADFHTHKQ